MIRAEENEWEDGTSIFSKNPPLVTEVWASVFSSRLETTAAMERERRRRCKWPRGGLYRTMGSIFGEIRPLVAEIWASGSDAM